MQIRLCQGNQAAPAPESRKKPNAAHLIDFMLAEHHANISDICYTKA
jgi:hypothetical protein